MAYAVLGLLALRSWTTYERAKQAQRSLRWFWPRAERKLYDEPKNLLADGLASARSETTGKPSRTVHGIMAEGAGSSRAGWTRSPPPAPATSRAW
jgi:DNA-binding PadR family transcriptional regulator